MVRHCAAARAPQRAHSLARSDAFRFRKSSTLSHPTRIYNVVPGDMTYDGKLDLLVMSAGGNKDISMTVYLGPFDSKHGTCSLNCGL